MVINYKAQAVFLLFTSLSFFFMGCGNESGYGELGLASVSGKITLDDKPLQGATVKFEADTGRFSYGVTNSSGYYSMMFDSTHSGVSPGKKIVRISMVPVGDDAEAPEGEGSEEGMQNNTANLKIPTRYNKESILSETVEKNKNQTFNFDLETE